MNKSNTSEIKIRKKIKFRPIMLTSKSIKPIDRSSMDKYKLDEKTNDPSAQMKKQSVENCSFYSRAVVKSQVIRKLTDQYREMLISNFCVAGTTDMGEKVRQRSITPSVIHVQFDVDKTLRSDSRYGKTNLDISCIETDADLKKYFYFTHSKNYESFIMLNKSSRSSANTTGLKSLMKSYGGSHQDTQDSACLNVKKLNPKSKNQNFESKISQDKLKEISVKVEEYQHNLIKKMNESYSGVYNYEPSPQERVQSPSNKEKTRFILSDNQKIEDDMTSKRQSVRKEHFVFGMSDISKANTDQITKHKFEMYKDFLWKINFSNGLYIKIKDEIDIPYKLYVGPGNNSMLIKGIMRRRFWWQITEKVTEEVNFVWTQIKLNDYFKMQQQPSKSNFSFNTNKIFMRNRKAHSALEHNNTDIVKDIELIKNQHNSNLGVQQISFNKKQQWDHNAKILSGKDYILWKQHMERNKKYEDKQETAYPKRIKSLVRKKQLKLIQNSRKLKVQNHFECNYYLGNKKALFYCMKRYYGFIGKDPFDFIPLTFHIAKGLQDAEYARFLQKYQLFQEKKKNKQCQNIWIVKPGEMTNRGRGITVCSTLDEIRIRLKSKEKAKNGQPHTYIVQKYIEKPLLYNRRKFDIRHYMMMTCVNGKLKGYWYDEGYLRTTSYQYNVKNCKDLYTHLTNDAIQKYSTDYGKFEKGNKVSYTDFQKYLNINYRSKTQKDPEGVDKYDFYDYILPKMKNIAADTMKAACSLISPNRYQHNFQLFGLDFMLDQDMNVYLIEVNTNPCLQTSCSLLSRLIPSVVQNVFKICVDPLFPPPFEWPTQKKMQFGDCLEDNHFSIIFNEEDEEKQLSKLYLKDGLDDRMGEIEQEDQVYQDQGKEWVEDQK